MNTKIRLGVVGGGQVGQATLEDLAATNGVDMVGLAEPEEALRRRIHQKSGIAVYPTLEALLQQARPDAVKICTPNSWHARHALVCLEAGVHVLCEKPLATGSDDARRIVQAARRSAKVFMVNFEYRRSRMFARIKQLLDAGEIGQARNFWFYESRPGFHGPEGGWRFKKGDGGLFGEKLCHYLDLVLWFGDGEFRRVQVRHGPNTLPHYEIPDHAMAFFEMQDGHTFTLATHHGIAADPPLFAQVWGSPTNLRVCPRIGHACGFRIAGTKGAIISDDWQQSIAINRLVRDPSGQRGGWRMEHERTEDFSKHQHPENVHNQAGMLAYFLDQCRKGQALIDPSPRHLLAVMAAVEAAERSAEHQTPELIAPERELAPGAAGDFTTKDTKNTKVTDGSRSAWRLNRAAKNAKDELENPGAMVAAE